MNNAYKTCLGQVISKKRRIANINRNRLSAMTGLSRLTIRKIETGEANPTLDVLLRMTQGIGISLGEAMTECERQLQELPPSALDEPYVLVDNL